MKCNAKLTIRYHQDNLNQAILQRRVTMKSNQGNSWVNLQDSEWNVTNLLDGMGCDYFTGTYRIFSTSWFQGIIYFFYSAIFVVALAGNGLVCYVVYSSPRMKTVTNFFIVNLAFGDILIALFCVPPSFISILILQYWPFGQEFCPTVSSLQVRSIFQLLTLCYQTHLNINKIKVATLKS
nr:PREDICTED: neuropeptide Y receptor-like isoform X2 [Megachile rotundata]